MIGTHIEENQRISPRPPFRERVAAEITLFEDGRRCLTHLEQEATATPFAPMRNGVNVVRHGDCLKFTKR